MPLLIPYLLSASSRCGLIRRPLDWNPLTLHLLLHPSGHVELLSHFGLIYKVTLILQWATYNRGSPLPLRLQGCLLLQTRRILHRQGRQQLIGVELVGIRVQGIRCKLEIH